jgi:lipoprotein-anchoring transpeptidase ErfK/SrfK
MDEPTLLPEDVDFLLDAGWSERVGENQGIWISVERQRFYLLEGLQPVLELVCATAEAGTGSVADSQQTPLGWHAVAEKFGEDAAWGQVFRSRAMSGEIWQPGTHVGEDLVLTRLLWLTGLEPGKNQGIDTQGVSVDSKARYIYIHGTNEEERLGIPSSHGCIRLGNDDVIEVFDRVPVGTPVLIAERLAD